MGIKAEKQAHVETIAQQEDKMDTLQRSWDELLARMIKNRERREAAIKQGQKDVEKQSDSER